MSLAWISIVFISLYEWLKKLYLAPTIYEEGHNYIIIEGTESTKYPDQYSEGVFAWYENGNLQISEEYQVQNGGDPLVFKKYLLKTNIKKSK
ncbi:hypothetical protein N8826_02155 [Gammaproteobacteria bacterium]|nr:hypothetical protein [Gammaproteobacteria bacterium]